MDEIKNLNIGESIEMDNLFPPPNKKSSPGSTFQASGTKFYKEYEQ